MVSTALSMLYVQMKRIRIAILKAETKFFSYYSSQQLWFKFLKILKFDVSIYPLILHLNLYAEGNL